MIWTPNHTNITGNGRAYKLAKEAIADAVQCQVYSLSDTKLIIKTKIFNIWQNKWKISNLKLSEIKSHILPWTNNTFTTKEGVAINRLRIDHTRTT